jgi:repeat protein
MKKKILLVAVMCVVLALCGLMVACGESDPEMRTVTYAAGETTATGTAPVQADVAEGSEFTVADNTFVNPGYTFVGWTEGKALYEAGASYRVGKQNVTLTAKWKENGTFAVNYAPGAGGGEFIETGDASAAEIKGGATFKTAANPYFRFGYEFDGWSDGTAVYAAGADAVMPADADLTLTAVWQPVSYTFKAGDKLVSTSNANTYLLVKEDGKFEFHMQVYDVSSSAMKDTVVGTYTCVVEGGKVTMTDAGDAEKVFEGDNYNGIFNLELPGSAGSLMSYAFCLPDVEAVEYITRNSANTFDMSNIITIGAYDNGVMVYTEQNKQLTVYGLVIGYKDGLFTYRLPGAEESVTVKFTEVDMGTKINFENSVKGAYTLSGEEIVFDGFDSWTSDGIVGDYTALSDSLIYIVDEDGGDAYVNVDVEAKTLTETSVSVYDFVDEEGYAMMSSVMYDGKEFIGVIDYDGAVSYAPFVTDGGFNYLINSGSLYVVKSNGTTLTVYIYTEYQGMTEYVYKLNTNVAGTYTLGDMTIVADNYGSATVTTAAGDIDGSYLMFTDTAGAFSYNDGSDDVTVFFEISGPSAMTEIVFEEYVKKDGYVGLSSVLYNGEFMIGVPAYASGYVVFTKNADGSWSSELNGQALTAVVGADGIIAVSTPYMTGNYEKAAA